MAEYKLEVTTGDMTNAGTFDHIYVTLIGTGGKSEQTELDNYGMDFKPGMTSNYTVKTSSSLGKLLLVKVEKDPFLCLPEDEWFCSKIVVTTPEGEAILFPCYRWISRGELVELRGGRATKVFEDDHPLLTDHRKNELMLKKTLYQGAELMFKGMLGSTESWGKIEDIKNIFRSTETPMSEYVSEHWKEDDFYGSQFLNGVNPNVIKRCSELPPNFPVTDEMVKPFLAEGTSLQKEMEEGNIFLCDYKVLDGLPTKVYDGESLHVTPGFIMFYLNPENKLMPSAIQLYQQPSEQNPIFLPSDPETDWLLAKMFIKNADLLQHQAVYHFTNSHGLAEVFTVATLRCFPVIHPLYKLLIPHFRYTLQINTAAKKKIFGPEGILSQSSLGLQGNVELAEKAHSKLTYDDLCLPENITARGLESISNFYYRDDGLKLWNIIYSFVKATVEYYYPSENDVRNDTELQDWISEIFTHGFLGNTTSGFPSEFMTVEEVIKFITMIIFTVTGQHAAVNNGQYDYYPWIPNGSFLLRKAPPTTKGQSSMKTLLETLPDVGLTGKFAALSWILSNKYTDTVPMGSYPDEQFDEPAPKQMIKEFQAELSYLSEEITTRNSQLEVPYTYLNPAVVENSITI
ncbi:hydroperoxide isomerase ALOXE3-like [Epinephelus moara]|uniref:hydroperoxide isomerase ALOXE3-like n=1 Tax=Epinephelus moara TaxID=300413 RepID=UPI00214E1D58|nr:hydroperoxide isomerase ALOXE3-like [Epinephelus moara]